MFKIKEKKFKFLQKDVNNKIKEIIKKEENPSPTIAQINRGLGHNFYQGDIILNLKQAEFLFSKFNLKRNRRQAINSVTFPTSLWLNRTVPYTFGNSISEERRTRIRQALSFWADQTCLNFREEELFQSNPSETRLQFGKGNGCSSYVGKQEGDQYVSIGEDCDQFGIITHEVAHALGFFHEQSRWDRDQFVSVSLDNIRHGYEDQFDKESEEENDNQQVPYDLGSVMHYSECELIISKSLKCQNVNFDFLDAFSSPDAHNPVLSAKEPYNQKTMGQRIAPSFLDVLLMNKRYMCLDDCKSRGVECKNGGFPKPKDCSQCICPWGFGGKFCDERGSSVGSNSNCGETIKVGISF
uniref:Zinc metalloproteinase n=1 Tax=Meloidogyne floridensis TaxID=298350 RepID=A0A915NVY8_9BILA